MNINLYRDSKGYPRAKSGKSLAVLCAFLESEVQQDKASGQEFIRAIADVQDGKINDWEETGNAHTLTLTQERAIINNEFTGGTCELSLGDLKQYVLDWLRFIEMS